MAEPRVMLVTALFDLPAREGNRLRRSMAEYFRHGELLLGLDQDIVFFVDPCFADRIKERREAHGLLHRTVVIPTPLEELPYYALRDQLAAAIKRNPVVNAKPYKETPLYHVVTWSKYAVTRWAMERDPFAASHVAWVDFAITHIARAQHCVEDRVFAQATERIKLLMLRPFGLRDVEDRHEIFTRIPSYIAAGWLSGSRSSFERLCTLFDAEARAALEAGYAPDDEQVLPRLCTAAPDLFEYYYGDYGAVLDNQIVIRSGAHHLREMMHTCGLGGDYGRCCEIGARVLASHRAGTLDVDAECLSSILADYFVAAFHLEAPEQRTAHEIAEYYAAFVRQDPGFAEAFRRRREQILTDFSFLKEPVQIVAGEEPAELPVPPPSIASCEDASGREQTMIWAARKLTRGGTPEELWAAHYLLAICHERLGEGAKLLKHALAAYERCPQRAEPLYLLAKNHRLHGRYESCMLFAELGARIPHPGVDAPLLEENVYRTGFAEEMSIAGCYCHDERHKAQGYAACLALTTSRSASEETRRLSLRNSSYYARSAEQLFGGVLLEELEMPGKPAEVSICLHEGALRCVVRGRGGPSHFLTLEESCLEPASCDCELQDARLLSSGGRLWCMGWSEGGSMNVVELDGKCRVVGVQSGGSAGSELKGWVPLLGEEPLRFIASTDPTVVGGAGEHHRSVPPLWLEGLQGASQAIALEPGWLYVGREELELESGRRYLHRFVLLDRSFKLLGLSAPFYLLGQRMERCGGLVRDEERGLLVASFSAGQGRACLASFVEKAVLARLDVDIQHG